MHLIAALSEPSAYPHAVGTVEVRHTHISVVFLAGHYAYKIKKPVQLGFLDFSTLEKRRHFCARRFASIGAWLRACTSGLCRWLATATESACMNRVRSSNGP